MVTASFISNLLRGSRDLGTSRMLAGRVILVMVAARFPRPVTAAMPRALAWARPPLQENRRTLQLGCSRTATRTPSAAAFDAVRKDRRSPNFSFFWPHLGPPRNKAMEESNSEGNRSTRGIACGVCARGLYARQSLIHGKPDLIVPGVTYIYYRY